MATVLSHDSKLLAAKLLILRMYNILPKHKFFECRAHGFGRIRPTKVFATPRHVHGSASVDPMRQPNQANLRISDLASTPSGVPTQHHH